MPNQLVVNQGASIPTAAEILGISEDEVRHRIAAGIYTSFPSSVPPAHEPLVNLPSLDLILAELKGRSDTTGSQITALDGKASFVLGSASLLAAGVASFQGTLTGYSGNRLICALGGLPCLSATPATFVHIVTLIAALIYTIVVYASWKAYKIRPYAAIKPTRLQRYAAHDDYATKVVLIQHLVQGYKEDEANIKEKVEWTQRALLAFLIEVGFLAFTLFLSVVL